MEAGQAVDLLYKSRVLPGGFDSFHPHHAALAQLAEAPDLDSGGSGFESLERHHSFADVAQSAEASGRDPEGWRFESSRRHQF